MLDPTRFYYYLFGLITLAGGIQGFMTKNSLPSLIAGSICGILLLVAGYLLQMGKVVPGLVVGLIITLALAGQFLPKFFKGGGWWPAGVEGWLGLIGVLLTIAAFVKK
ncbi:MAG: TMEM14 family protein [Chthoniobacter sp.]|uniref:TMEM14 family protein n=1 Tax=Chthoniobacter sp. TaxID=2510640 RepID=UPI0032AB2E8C